MIKMKFSILFIYKKAKTKKSGEVDLLNKAFI